MNRWRLYRLNNNYSLQSEEPKSEFCCTRVFFRIWQECQNLSIKRFLSLHRNAYWCFLFALAWVQPTWILRVLQISCHRLSSMFPYAWHGLKQLSFLAVGGCPIIHMTCNLIELGNNIITQSFSFIMVFSGNSTGGDFKLVHSRRKDRRRSTCSRVFNSDK